MRVLMFIALTWLADVSIYQRSFNMALLTCKPFDISGQHQCRHAPEWSEMVDKLRRFDA